MSSRQWTPSVCGTYRLPWSPSVGKHSRAQGIRVSYFTIVNMFHLSLGETLWENAFDSWVSLCKIICECSHRGIHYISTDIRDNRWEKVLWTTTDCFSTGRNSQAEATKPMRNVLSWMPVSGSERYSWKPLPKEMSLYWLSDWLSLPCRFSFNI